MPASEGDHAGAERVRRRKPYGLRRSTFVELGGEPDELGWTVHRDREGDLYRTRYVSGYHSDDCQACQAGKCIQKLIDYEDGGTDVIVHHCANELN